MRILLLALSVLSLQLGLMLIPVGTIPLSIALTMSAVGVVGALWMAHDIVDRRDADD